jgi:NADH-quinone oxidoreductase subunit M
MGYLSIVLAPIFLAVVIYVFFHQRPALIRGIALATFVLQFGVSMHLLSQLPDTGFLALGSFLVVDAFHFSLALQVDSLSVVMLLLGSLLLMLVTLSSWTIDKPAAYFSLLIAFSGAMMGVFMTSNMLWFFMFWELTLLPMFFLVGIWGGERRVYAAIKFFLYTHAASVLMLLAFLLVYAQTGFFDFTLVKEAAITTPALVWWLLFIGFAIKLPVFPFHTWLPDAHVEAPAPVSVLLAGVLLKMGAYGLIRFGIEMMPETSREFAVYMLGFGLLTAFFAGLLAIVQTHIKKMVAYSSISHMGLVLIAISTVTVDGLSAALFEMLGHAAIISPLFLIAGIVYHQTGSYQMRDMGGMMQQAPYLSAIFVLAGMAALGMPATMGFIGEVTIYLSSIKVFGAGIAVMAIISLISAGYLIWTFRRVIYGELSPLMATSSFNINRIEFSGLLVFALLIVLFGVYPQPIFDVANQSFALLGGHQ